MAFPLYTLLTHALDGAKALVVNMLVSKHKPRQWKKKENIALYCHCIHNYTFTDLFFPQAIFTYECP